MLLNYSRLITIAIKSRQLALRSLIVAACSFLISSAGFPQLKFYENGQPTRSGPDAAMFPDSPTREKIDLAGVWQYSLDGKEWRTVSVPSAYDFEGKVIFTRKFEVKPEMLDQNALSLVVYGINHESEISINGSFISRHQGGYASFVVAIPATIVQLGKENAIRVVVDNELTPTTTLPIRQQAGGWRTYGGIFRDIYILATPKLYIDEINVKSDVAIESKSTKVAVGCGITDFASGIKPEPGKLLGFQVEAFDKLTGESAGRSGLSPVFPLVNKTVEVRAEVVIAAPKYWAPSPDTSNLYVFKCQIVRIVNKEITVLDEYSVDVGLRDVRWKDGRMYVNGKLTPLKGLLWHEDHSTFASAMTYEALERDVASIRSIGANLIRFPYPPHPYILNLCDRYGLMVMEEVPLVAVPAEIMARDYYQDLAATYVKEMVARDQNHVSVIAWGVGDGFETGSPAACEFVNTMRNMIHSSDHRPVYFATGFLKETCFEYTDMIAINHESGDAKDLRETLKQLKTRYPEKPIVVARYGIEVEPGNRNGYSDPLSMEAQARTAMLHFDVIRDSKIAGSVLWSFGDWRTDRPSVTTHSHDPYLKTMGIVGYQRDKRIAFDVTRAMFNGEKVQALPIGNYASSTPIVYVLAGLVALISLAFFYNGNRRFRDAVNRSMFRTYNFFADVRDQRILTYGHSIFLALVISLTWSTLLSSVLSYYRDSIFLDNLLNQMMPDQIKERFVQLIWSPFRFIIVMSVLFAAFLLLLSVVVRILSMMVRTRVYFYHAFSVTMWSLLPYIVLIPIVMILYRLLDGSVYVFPIVTFIVFISLWVLFRLLKGVSIICDVYPIKVYAVGLLMLIVISAAFYGYIDYTQSTSVYLKYMMRAFRNSL